MCQTISQLQNASAEQQEIIHSYAETISMLTAQCFTSYWEPFTKIYPTNEMGQIELCNIIISWANEFEKQNEGREWDGEFYEAIDNFIESKIL